MENKKLIFLAAILAAAINVFAVGTLIYFAVDAFALYSENQFTGRMRSFDVDYWNAIGGSAVIIIPTRLAAAFTRKMKRMEIDRRATDESDNILNIMDELERSFRNTDKWDPPKI
jgi:hypothetical protein